jgi:hypothetical protein
LLSCFHVRAVATTEALGLYGWAQGLIAVTLSSLSRYRNSSIGRRGLGSLIRFGNSKIGSEKVSSSDVIREMGSRCSAGQRLLSTTLGSVTGRGSANRAKGRYRRGRVGVGGVAA